LNWRSILNFLGVEDDIQVSYQDYIQPREVKLLPEVKKGAPKVYKKLEEYFKRFHYTID
jgi:hypothetical protein